MSLFASEPPPRVWGVGRVVVGGEVTAWPVSQADIDDEAASMAEHLQSLGVGRGDVVLVVALLSEAIHAVPLEQAAGLLGALYSAADATEPDAFRTEYLVGQLRPRAVIGVNRAVIDGLRARGRDPADVLREVPAVAAADEPARRALADAGVPARRWAKLGPTSAFECATRSGLHLDGARWEVDLDDGQVHISNRVDRLTPCERLATGFRGTVRDGPCACGRDGPLVVPAPA
jgi:hypothetical protein